MSRRIQTVIGVILGGALFAQAQSPPVAPAKPPQAVTTVQGQAVPAQHSLPWVVTVVHAIETRKVIQRMQADSRTRIGVPGSMPERLMNFATGVVLDEQGHIITRLSIIDPEDKDQAIVVITNQGVKLTAKFVGLDCPSGFVVLHVPSLKVALPVVAAAERQEHIVKIISTDVAAKGAGAQNKAYYQLTPSMKVLNGRIEDNNAYARLRGASMLRSPNFLSRNDGAIVTTSTDQILGLAQFAGVGRAYLFPMAMVRDTIARRVIENKKSVPSGWLGVTGVNLFNMSAEEIKAAGVEQRAGIFIKEVNADSPAAKSGIMPRDILIGFDSFNLTNTGELGALLSASPSGRPVKLRALRDGKPTDFEVVLGAKAYSEALLAWQEIGMRANSQENLVAELDQRIRELQTQIRNLYQTPKNPQRDEAINELSIELQGLFDVRRPLGPVASQPVEPPPAFFGRGQEPVTCQMKRGFTAREMTNSLAEHQGAPKSVWVIDVKKGSPAESAGLAAGDVIVNHLQKPLTCSKLEAMFARSQQPVTLQVIRKKQPLTLTIKPQ